MHMRVTRAAAFALFGASLAATFFFYKGLPEAGHHSQTGSAHRPPSAPSVTARLSRPLNNPNLTQMLLLKASTIYNTPHPDPHKHSSRVCHLYRDGRLKTERLFYGLKCLSR